MEAVGALGGARALLSASTLRLCFVTRSQALALEPLEEQLLRESAQDSEAAAPSPDLRPSILAGSFVRVRCDDTYRLDRVAHTQLTGDDRIAVRLQVTGRCVPLASLSRGSPLEDEAAREQQGQQELAALQGALEEQPPTCWEIASACCRLSTAWQWAQQPSEFAAALQRGLPSLTSQLEDAAAVQAVLSCVEPAAAPAAAAEPSASAAAEQFLAAMASQPVAPSVAAEPTAAVAAAPLGVPTPAQPLPLPPAMPAGLVATAAGPPAGAAPAAAAAGNGGFFFEAPGSSSGWEEPPDQYQRVVTFVPDDEMGERRQKRGQEERSSPPAKRQRSEASPAAASPAVRPSSSTSEHNLRRIADSVPPGGKGEALLLQAVERSCAPGEERQGGELGIALSKLDRAWKDTLGRHSLTNLLLAMSHRGLVRAEVRPDPNDRSGGSNVFYSRAPARMAPPAAKPSSSKRVAKDVPPGSRREALLVQAIEQSCQPGEERQGGDLGKALAALDSDWKERLGGHSITNLLLVMQSRGLVRAQVRTDPSVKNGTPNVYYSRAPARSSPAAAKPADSKQVAAHMPPGSGREALLIKAVAELDSKRQGQQLAAANLGEVLHRLDRDWRACLGGHRLYDLVWELDRRGLVRAEDRAAATGQINLFFTNLRC